MLEQKTISQIATMIEKDWKNIYFGAVPYLEAMHFLSSIDDNYICDSGSSVIAYFLSNATTWKGPIAREIKKELNKRLKTAKY